MKTILIVEDEFRSREGLAKLIEKVSERFKVIGTAENGYEGLQLIAKEQPDIVITDIRMPRVDGLKMIEEALQFGAKCDFVVLSGYSEFEYARKGLRLGVKDYLSKPISITEVKELLERFTEKPEETSVGKEQKKEIAPVIRAIMDAVEENCGEHHRLETIAEKYRMTPEYLSNLFTKETDMSFSNFKKKVRMEKAKQLLLTTDLKVYEVACAVGYPDQKYFSKVFKEYTGISAKQFAINHAISVEKGEKV